MPDLADAMEEDSEGEEESGLEYETDEELEEETSKGSYLTPIPTLSASPAVPSSSAPTQSPTPDYKGLDQLACKTIKCHIKDFLVGAEEDLKLSSNPPPLETPSPEPVPVLEPICPFEGFVPFAVSPTNQGQHCVPLCGLLR